MFVKQNLQQVYFIVIFLLTFGTSTVRATPLNNSLSKTENEIAPRRTKAEIAFQQNRNSFAPEISFNQKIKPQLDNDPDLVGLWLNSSAPCPKDSCLPEIRQTLILPDGTFLQGDSQLVAATSEHFMVSSSDRNFDSATILNGEWKTANHIVYARASKSYQWIPVFRYRIQDSKMFLTFPDGSREIWNKSYTH